MKKRLDEVTPTEYNFDYCSKLSSAIGLSSEKENSNCTATEWGSLSAKPYTPSQQNCTQYGLVVGDVGTTVTSLDKDAPVEDFSLYDEAVGIPLPLVFMLWETNQTDTGSTTRVILGPELMCIPAPSVVGNSRAIPKPPTNTTDPSDTDDKDDAAIRNGERVQIALFAAVLVSVLFSTIV
jgi:hypothetical protein